MCVRVCAKQGGGISWVFSNGGRHQEHNILDIYSEHFALLASFAVYDFSHRKDLFELFGFLL